MAFPKKARLRHLQVEGFSRLVVKWNVMKVNLWHRHVRDNVIILKEGNPPSPTVTPM